MRANKSRTLNTHTLKTIYCAFFLAFFIAGAICGFFLADEADAHTLRRHCVAFCLSRRGLIWLVIPLVRFVSVLMLCGRFRIGAVFMPLLVFLRGVSAVFFLSAFCRTLPEIITFGRGIAYFVYMVLSLSVFITFGWMAMQRLYSRNFGRTSYGQHHHEV